VNPRRCGLNVEMDMDTSTLAGMKNEEMT
jgi:hypothetical protein